MYLIVGLGNPEEEYNRTRHNMGFNVINKLAEQLKIDVNKKKFDALYGDANIENEKVILLKPQRKKGGAGTHNGMKSVVNELNTEDFIRVRVGIGKPIYKDDMINYVIGAIPEEEQKLLQQGVDKAKDAILEILKNGIDIAMNKFNI